MLDLLCTKSLAMLQVIRAHPLLHASLHGSEDSSSGCCADSKSCLSLNMSSCEHVHFASNACTMVTPCSAK